MSEKTGQGQSGGVNIAGSVGSVGGDIVGRDKILGAPSAAALDGALAPLIEAIGAAPVEKRAEAEAKLTALKLEAAKGEAPGMILGSGAPAAKAQRGATVVRSKSTVVVDRSALGCLVTNGSSVSQSIFLPGVLWQARFGIGSPATNPDAALAEFVLGDDDGEVNLSYRRRNKQNKAATVFFITLLASSVLRFGGDLVREATAEMATQSFELLEATVPQLQAALTAGTVTSRDLVTMYLARIDTYDQHGPALNAISVKNGNALAEADGRDAERRAGTVRGPLHGIPIIIKDNYETAGMQTADGSRLLAGWVPSTDATIIKKLRQAGAIIIAKSNMHEFAYGITTVGSLFGQTRNPYAPDRNPGGSSGGTGAAIAANFAAVGMGSDTCGSIRIPASHNSLVGIRGTQGLASRNGIIPLSSTQDIGGPIGRTVTDIAIVLDTIVGYDPTDPQTAASVGDTPNTYTDFLQLTGLRGVRIGVLTNLLGTEPEDTEVATVVRAAVNEMKTQGAEIVEVTIPGLAELLVDHPRPNLVLVQDFKFDLNAYLASRPTAPVRTLEEVLASGKYHPAVEANLRFSQGVESRETAEYFAHIVKRSQLREAILKAMADNRVDALAYPTIRRKANLIGEMQMGNNCQLASKSGLPAIVVPGGFTGDGLPVGVELSGRAWSEPQLIKFAYAYEEATRHRRPPASTPAIAQR